MYSTFPVIFISSSWNNGQIQIICVSKTNALHISLIKPFERLQSLKPPLYSVHFTHKMQPVCADTLYLWKAGVLWITVLRKPVSLLLTFIVLASVWNTEYSGRVKTHRMKKKLKLLDAHNSHTKREKVVLFCS